MQKLRQKTNELSFKVSGHVSSITFLCRFNYLAPWLLVRAICGVCVKPWLCSKWRTTRTTHTNPAPILSMQCVHTVQYANFVYARNARMYTQSASISEYGAELASRTASAPQCIAHLWRRKTKYKTETDHHGYTGVCVNSIHPLPLGLCHSAVENENTSQ